MGSRHVSARQAAQMLGVSKAYTCRLFSTGAIPVEKVATDWIDERKNVQRYLDDKSRIPLYCRETRGWDRDDFYFLFRCLDKMVNDRRNRYDEELSALDCEKLSSAARAILRAEKAHERFPNLASLTATEPLSPPLVLSDYPCPGAFPDFEEMGLIL